MKVKTLEDGIASLRISTDEAPYLDASSLGALTKAVGELERADSVRAVLVEGGSRYFSGGARRDSLLDPEERANITRFCRQFPELLLRIPVPTVAAMVGHGVGGGWMIGLWCDLAVMAEEGLYGANFMALGFTPGMGSTRLLAEAVGAPLARELLYTGRLVKGRELTQSGGPLAHAVVPRDVVRDRALDIARDIAGAPRESLLLLKAAFSEQRRQLLEQASRVERRMHDVSLGDEAVMAGIAERYSPGSQEQG